MSDRTSNVGTGVLAFALGLIAGGITALLLAPASGEETRRKIGDLKAKVGERARKGIDDAKHIVGEQKDRVGTAIVEGRKAYQRESMSTAGSSDRGQSGA
jgi:gas vesicle protein